MEINGIFYKTLTKIYIFLISYNNLSMLMNIYFKSRINIERNNSITLKQLALYKSCTT